MPTAYPAFSPIRLWQEWSLPFTVARCNCSRNCSAVAHDVTRSKAIRRLVEIEADGEEMSNVIALRIRFGISLFALVFAAILVQPNVSSAVTVEVARKCQALTSKAFPPRELGNPAAGSAKGSGLDQQKYFEKCVANGGRVDDASPKDGK